MNTLKNVLIALAGVLIVAMIFFIVVLICSRVNNLTLYHQLKLWFGAGSEFAKTFTGI